MIIWEFAKAFLLLIGALTFSKEFYIYTHFLNKLNKSDKILRTHSRIIPNSTFFAMWCLCLFALFDMWLSWVVIIVRIFHDY